MPDPGIFVVALFVIAWLISLVPDDWWKVVGGLAVIAMPVVLVTEIVLTLVR